MGISFGKLAGRRSIVASVLLAAGAGAWAQGKNNGTDKVVYHIDNAAAQATKGLRNVRNHLDAEGIDFLMEGAKDAKNPDIDYPSLVSALKARGVRFEVCEITLRNRNLKKEQFIMDADFTPSGVARIGQLQNREQFAYIKP